MKSDATLLTSANTIKNETSAGANTASRVGTMLADLVNEKANVKSWHTKAPRPILTLRLDDGLAQQYSWFQYLQNLTNFPSGAIKATICVNTAPMDAEAATHITWAQAAEMEAAGWEIASHGDYHSLDTLNPRPCWQCEGTGLVDEEPCPTCTTGGLFPLTPAVPGYVYFPYWYDIPAEYKEQVITEELVNSKASIEAQGLHVYNMIPPGYSQNDALGKELSTAYYRSCHAGGSTAPKNGINLPVVDHYNICAGSIDLEGREWDFRTVGATAAVTAALDAAIADNLWVIVYWHGYYGNADFTTHLKAIIDYAIANDVEIVTLNEGLDICGDYYSAGSNFGAGEKGVHFNRCYGEAASIDKKFVKIGLNAARLNWDDHNTSIGGYAGFGIRDGSAAPGMVLIGYRAGYQSATNGSLTGDAEKMIAIGSEAGSDRVGNCLFIGDRAGYRAGTKNTPAHIYGTIGIGTIAFYTATNCVNGIAIGYQAGAASSGTNCTYLGYQAGKSNSGTNTVLIGYQAGVSNAENDVFIVHHESADDGSPLIKGYFASGGIILGCPTSALADATMGKNRVTFWHDEAANKIYFKVKYNDGTTVKTGELAIA